MHSLFPDCAQLDLRGGYQVFEVGKEKVGAPGGTRDALFALGPVFSALDQAKADLGIESYTLSQTTLEQVFLNISSEQVDDTAAPSSPRRRRPPRRSRASSRRRRRRRRHNEPGVGGSLCIQ